MDDEKVFVCPTCTYTYDDEYGADDCPECDDCHMAKTEDFKPVGIHPTWKQSRDKFGEYA